MNTKENNVNKIHIFTDINIICKISINHRERGGKKNIFKCLVKFFSLFLLSFPFSRKIYTSLSFHREEKHSISD